ncbi:MAG: malate synthase G, partial [Pseudomonadota bacterium]
MSDRVKRHGLNVARALADFIETQALPGTELDAETVWAGLARMVRDLGPRNVELLHHRDRMQIQVDAWHVKTRGHVHDADAYETFLKEIGYLVPEGPDFQIDTANVDPEIAEIPGPQLVVPITNARFALNAANARWGSLYDALYGTDALGDLPTGPGYDSDRGSRVIERAKGFLDDAVPLAGGTWGEVDRLGLDGLLPVIATGDRALSLAGPASYEGHAESNGVLSLLFRHNGLRIELVVDPASRIGRDDPAGLSDIRLESAMSTIMDCEDSVACVDAADKVQAYSNWLGLMKGDLEESFEKAGQPVTRRMKPDRVFTDVHGQPFMVKSCSLLLVRNVGHLMTNPAVLDPQGNEIGEGLMDALCTTLIAMHDLARDDGNSVCGSVYVVKPKMHGPAEVAFAVEIFDMVEDILGLPRNTVKLGIMDEERRTSVNLKECIRAAASRVAFINTGFLDRTGDEIHTSMEAGPMVRKADMKAQRWIGAYEDWNVDTGLACGLSGIAQIGKGMWAAPDLMGDMLGQKIGHPRSGASCAWVPSPTAATLHATHYHRVDVAERQRELRDQLATNGPRASIEDLLDIPVDD